MAALQIWHEIPNNAVRHIWRCDECGAVSTNTPDWYELNGTPVCVECDIDMDYQRTETKHKYSADCVNAIEAITKAQSKDSPT